MRRAWAAGVACCVLCAAAPSVVMGQGFQALPFDDPKTVVNDSLGAYWDSTEVAAAISDSITAVSPTEDHFDGSFQSPTGSTGTFYEGGYYLGFGDAAQNWAVSASTTLGTANGAYEAHVGFVSGGASKLDSLRVVGTTIDEATGTRTAPDTSIVVFELADAENTYKETPEKFTGQVTIERITSAGSARSTNIGYTKYFDDQNRDFVLTGFDIVGRAGATDAGFNIKVRKHTADGWDYDALGLAAGDYPAALYKLNDYTERSTISGENFVMKRTSLADTINGNNGEGIMLEFVTMANNAVESLNFRVEYDRVR